jgi:hypothetical protein
MDAAVDGEAQEYRKVGGLAVIFAESRARNMELKDVGNQIFYKARAVVKAGTSYY